MSDAHLRDLERRWRESGRAEDEVAWLTERLRVGELLPRWLELAAFVGHPAARSILGEAAPATPASLDELLEALHKDWGLAVYARAIVACVENALPDLPPESDTDEVVLPRMLLSLRRWTDRPCGPFGRHARRAGITYGAPPQPPPPDPPPWWRSLCGALGNTCSAVDGYLEHAAHIHANVLGAAEHLGEERIVAAIREALINWSLEPHAEPPPQGTAEAEQAALRRRLERGELQLDDLVLGAQLEDAACAAVLGADAPELLVEADMSGDVTREQLRTALAVIAPRGAEAAVRLGLPMLIPHPERDSTQIDEAMQAVFDAARAWALGPEEPLAERAIAAGQALRASVAHLPESAPIVEGIEAPEPDPTDPFAWFAQPERPDLDAAFRRWTAERIALLGELTRRPERLPELMAPPPDGLGGGWLEFTQSEWLDWATPLLTWRLGYGDPLRDAP